MKKKTAFLTLFIGLIVGSLFAKGSGEIGLSKEPVALETTIEEGENLAKKNVCAHEKFAFHCVKYLRNYDADTLTFDIPNVHPFIGENISVRVYGLDAPELTSKDTCEKEMARHGKKLVERLLKGAKQINLLNIKKDKYFRILADVEIDGQDLGKILLKNNLAYEYYGGTKLKKDWCKHQVRQKNVLPE